MRASPKRRSGDDWLARTGCGVQFSLVDGSALKTHESSEVLRGQCSSAVCSQCQCRRSLECGVGGSVAGWNRAVWHLEFGEGEGGRAEGGGRRTKNSPTARCSAGAQLRDSQKKKLRSSSRAF
ncbi:hypothetical protein GQ53DRAFT_380771 [Thozetella sp. PMI_491]|nr:hypothetical protein GQ53DRAFT_380771 [Thozetella sp. PMI_491]